MGDFFISADQLYDWHTRGVPYGMFDVRRPKALESNSRLLPMSRWRDHMDVEAWSTRLDPAVPVVVNCMHGHNVSQIAGIKLGQLGFDARVLAGGVDAWCEAGFPTIAHGQLAPVDAQQPSHWITRLGARVNRIACSWLVRRFIDADAIFHFAETEWILDIAEETGAISFDTPGAEISNFDTLIRTFDVQHPALEALAAIVRTAGTDRLDRTPEAAGLRAVLLGTAERAEDDHHALQLGLPVYDALYARLSGIAKEDAA